MAIPSGPVWHPFTQHATDPAPPRITRTEAQFLFAGDRRILDAVSSWWVVTHGHRHPAIMAAIRDTAERLDQVIFAGLTHEPAEALAEALVSLAPAGLNHVFFSDSGSTAVEVALKMALGYWHHSGQPRGRIVVMEHSYHGDTIGTMSVGERRVFNAAYGPLMFDVDQIPFPGNGDTLAAFEALCQRGNIAALIVEPLVLGAGGMLIYGPEVLTGLRAVCDRHGVLLIADEVMTGWGRTGTLWACGQAGVAPDILCTSKGLTGGAIPLAATLATGAIFDAHYSSDRSRTFFHSSSYTANPIACAAALANIGIWQDEPVQARINALTAMQAERLATFADDPRFANLRQCGTIAALDLAGGTGYMAEDGPRLRAHFLDRDLLIRPLGSSIYLLPPYCVTGDDLDRCYAAIRDYNRP
ncbi:MAG: adenosylmethionine--8-amino-7-oxononanoate transaminase [Paracoccus sp. (in: a-proteobacteria)]|uniref:adenosylmethionine--8-amino-7-oxononanoate transaminase n=1 Tax=Paracoccus sp. TaxID=267 RepID=UPI0026DEDF86|nr:adenosylmethionine--8-amino-7-oxononanoate transaminase [Paracoccus sp. (in: a-proteobacteria)]MDO5621679.1 adenosylmethionine--8-amino-7-oxononanoate transaminase [Paracoccus sp. (in: a-proteobacteria)]